MKNKNTLITIVIIFVVLVILAVLYFYYFRAKIKTIKTEKEAEKAPVTVTGNTSAPSAYNTPTTTTPNISGFPLKQGSTGTEVYYLQAALNYYHAKTLELDGNFGPLTEAALYSVAKIKEVSYYYYQNAILPYKTKLTTYLSSKGVTV